MEIQSIQEGRSLLILCPKRKRTRIKDLALICVLLILIACQERELKYYDNGSKKLEVPLINGKRNGLLVDYYEDGKIKSKGNWVEGEQHGKAVFFYHNGLLEQEYQFDHGKLCCEARFYREDGSLSELQYFDAKGRMTDFKKFKSNGTRNFDIETRVPIILPETDTLKVGESFEAIVKLGNRRFNWIAVIVGDFDDKNLLSRPKLPMKDSVSAILKLKVETPGVNTVRGVIVEKNILYPDSLLVIPFSKSFFVKGKPLKRA